MKPNSIEQAIGLKLRAARLDMARGAEDMRRGEPLCMKVTFQKVAVGQI